MPVCKKDRQNIADEDRARDNVQPGFIEPFNIVRTELLRIRPMLDPEVLKISRNNYDCGD